MHKPGAMMQSSRALVHFGVVCMLIGLVASDERAPSLALFVPPAGLRPVAVPGPQTMPATPLSAMTPADSPGAQMPVAPEAPVDSPSFMMPTTVDSPGAQMPIGQPSMNTIPQYLLPMDTTPQSELASPVGFLGGFLGGLAAGAAFVYSIVKRTGQKVSNEVHKLELGALSSAAVANACVAPAEAPKSLVVKSTALAPYLAGGASLPAVLKQVTSGKAAMPPFGRQLRAIDTGRGRMRVVVNMQLGSFFGSGSAKAKPPPEPEFAYGLPGGGNILGEWDPAGYLENKSKLEVYRLREAELTHGRVGMLASLGFLVQEKVHPLFSGDGGPAIDQIPQLPVWLWVVMIGGIGAAESKRIAVGWAELDPETSKAASALKEGYYPGDLGFDPLGLKPSDPAEFRLMQEKELSHCRLAMIAAAGFLAQEAVSGDTWGAYWGDASF